jgi:hypothetical protein
MYTRSGIHTFTSLYEGEVWFLKCVLNYAHFSPFGATALIWALAYLHETFRFTSVY